MLLGFSFEARPDGHVLGKAGTVMNINGNSHS